ncbi:MAG TPA: DUF4167 domain-containing protein [Bauldia sp.]|nr:DUF4167 domain-containing protein [Bauldia sp.]
MRQGQQNKRMRGRNRKGPNPLTRSYESNGPDVKVRGTALHIAEKYVQLARDAQSAGDRVQAENYLQHAEHYYRIVSAAQAQMPQPQQVFRNDVEGDEEEDRGQMAPMGGGQSHYQQFRGDQPGYASEPQPYVNGNGQDRGDEQPVIDDLDDGQPESQPETQFRPEGGESPQREGRREGGFRSRRRRPYRDRGERGGEAQGGGQPDAAGAGSDE